MSERYVNPLSSEFNAAIKRAYRIVNVVSKTVLSLSGKDHARVTGWPMNSGKNQQWTIEPAGDYHMIINARFGAYLGYSGQFRGASVVGVGFPTQWAIVRDEEDPTSFRFLIPGHDLTLELTEHGSPTRGTPVVVVEQSPARYQTWRLLQA